MRDEYDFSNAVKNPYAKGLKAKVWLLFGLKTMLSAILNNLPKR